MIPDCSRENDFDAIGKMSATYLLITTFLYERKTKVKKYRNTDRCEL